MHGHDPRRLAVTRADGFEAIAADLAGPDGIGAGRRRCAARGIAAARLLSASRLQRPSYGRSGMVNTVLWSVQIFLALFFLGAAMPKLAGRGLERWTGFSQLPRGLVLGIGTAEVLGSVGLVLPMATGILPWLTPLAAIGLAINVLMATGFHVREDERLKAIVTTLWAVIAGIITIGRWNLIDQAALRISPRALAVGLMVLLPVAITIAIIGYRRPAPTTEPR